MSTLLFEQADVNGGTVEVLDVKPPAHKQINEPPVYIDTGFLCDLKTCQEYIQKVKESGRRVVGVRAPHGIDADIEGNLSKIEQRKIVTINWLRTTKNIQLLNTVSHSMGAITTSAAIEADPSNYNNALLFNPAGLMGPDSMPAWLARTVHDASLQCYRLIHDPIRLAEMYRLGVKACMQHPRLSLNEMNTIVHANIADRIHAIRSKINGVRVVAAANDTMFPIQRMRQQLGEDKDLLVELPGTHTSMITEPNAFVECTIESFAEMESAKS